MSPIRRQDGRDQVASRGQAPSNFTPRRRNWWRRYYPAWKKAIALLQAQSAKATDDAGLWRLKGGADAYAYFLHRYTTTNLTAAEIHEIGLKQVKQIESQMDVLLRRWAGPKVR